MFDAETYVTAHY